MAITGQAAGGQMAGASWTNQVLAPSIEQGTGLPSTSAAPAVYNPTLGGNLSSTTPIMAGFGSTCVYTPKGSGSVLLITSGTGSCSGSGTATYTVGIRYGTGTAPSVNATATGTSTAQGDLTVQPNATGHLIPFTLTALLSLTVGTTYWFDLAGSSQSASGLGLSSLSLYLAEQGYI